MAEKNYYNYYEILFSLRKEYLKNQKTIKKLLSYIRITGDSFNEYNPSLIFKTNSPDSADSLLLIVRKRQTSIRLMLDSLYNSIVYSDPDLKSGCFSYAFRPFKKYIYLLDDNQDGRYLKAKVEITNQNEFIELYRELIKNAICRGRTNLVLREGILHLSNNGIHLLHVKNDDYRHCMKLDYDGLGDHIVTNTTSHLGNLMELKINKSIIPSHFENVIDNNMDNYSYTIEGERNDRSGFYTIEGYGRKLVLKPENGKEYIQRQ